ncbi:MAG TPA: geranylgeranyl reductase family protein [Acidimicrobiales bacterium]|nr:geranylgeranyl reductase family protein [Acidimicrobiales bacterium]
MASARTQQAALRPALPAEHSCEVLVVGSGPSGAAAAFWLAEAGFDVVAVEKKHFPREKTCGDGLTPRSVRQLADMGLADALERHHRFDGLRALAFGKELLLPWPEHPEFPRYGYVVTRSDLDALVAARAEKAGATLWQGVEAVAPLGGDAASGGPALGAVLVDRDHGTTCRVRARYVVVADGANSRFGRALGATRDRALPLGMAIRGYYESPRHDETWIESHLDIRARDGGVVPGYGWIFPLGDGRVNVGVGLLSTSDRWRQINTTKLMEAFVAYAPASWCLGPATALGPATGGRLPMGLSVGPHAGPDYLLVGDAGGSINPFNGEGIAYGYETGRLAAASVGEALVGGDARLLAGYDARLQEHYGLYYRVASACMHVMGRADLMRLLVGTGMYSRSLMEWVLRIMANLLRPDELGPAEAAYRALAAIASRAD